MPMKGRIATTEKILVVENYLAGKIGYAEILRIYGISDSTLYTWVRLYKARGAAGLKPAEHFRQYPAELKAQIVQEYLAGGTSLSEICRKYDISTDRVVRDWIKNYNGQKGFGNPNSGRRIYMTIGRKVSLEERIEIVSYCISNGKDYAKAIEKYQVSYQQIYAWIRKYEKSGVEGLVDKRGKRKLVEEMTEVERLRAENRMLQAENMRKDMEIDILKKVQEVERRQG